MIDRKAEGDAAADLLERRWFASIAAVRTLEAECDVLREVMELAQSSWRQARGRLEQLQAVCEALGDELAQREAFRAALASVRIECTESSAA